MRKLLIHNLFKNKNGYTLVEILVVIAVIAILATTVAIVINPVAQLEKGQDSHRKSDLAQIQRALELYYHDNGRYPTSGSGYTINSVGWGASWSPYMAKIPQDPTAGKSYVYVVSPDGQSYWLYANLARGRNDPQACNSGNNCVNAPGSVCGSGKTCNFGVSSPNVSP